MFERLGLAGDDPFLFFRSDWLEQQDQGSVPSGETRGACAALQRAWVHDKRNANTTAMALSDHLGPRFKDVAEEMWGHLSGSEQAEIVENIYGPDEDKEPDTGEIIGEQPGEDVKPEPPRVSIVETLTPIEHPKGG